MKETIRQGCQPSLSSCVDRGRLDRVLARKMESFWICVGFAFLTPQSEREEGRRLVWHHTLGIAQLHMQNHQDWDVTVHNSGL